LLQESQPCASLVLCATPQTVRDPAPSDFVGFICLFVCLIDHCFFFCRIVLDNETF
jgi:hypothetical protein